MKLHQSSNNILSFYLDLEEWYSLFFQKSKYKVKDQIQHCPPSAVSMCACAIESMSSLNLAWRCTMVCLWCNPRWKLFFFQNFFMLPNTSKCSQKFTNNIFLKKIEILRLLFKIIRQILMLTASNYSNYKYKYPCSSFFMPSLPSFAKVLKDFFKPIYV